MINAAATYLREGLWTLFVYRWGGPADLHDQKYVPPGGHLERGERFIDCAVRECEEETGLRPTDLRLRMVVIFDNHGRILGDNETPEDWCVNIYEGSHYSGTLRPENDQSRPVWIVDTEVSHIAMHAGDRRLWELLQEKGIYEVRMRYSGTDLTTFDHIRVD